MVAKKHRYLLVEALFDQSSARSGAAIGEDELLQVIQQALATNWGDFGESLAQLRLLCWSPTVNLGILRCARPAADHLSSALALVGTARRRPIQLRVHRIGGTLRAMQSSAAELLHTWEQRAVARAGTAEEVAAVRRGFAAEASLLAGVGRSSLAALL
eukprot:TRINITY_DN40345_c0_g1_i1.p2 TRINITY_DN40345_c0_g1~~TRINITY_DN40345_c0_g1_i1.p2  ORF type:complete len:158 (+),score=41.54 TRINITY_DN40345_c0_g1_i1:129-602(+)